MNPKVEKYRSYEELGFSVRVAYQYPVKDVTFKSDRKNVLCSTLEDALVMENLDLFAEHDGTGLWKKFKEAINDSADLAALHKTIFKDLEHGSKAKFALDLLMIGKLNKLKSPTYIQNGLIWLSDALQAQHSNLNPDDTILNENSGVQAVE